MLEVNDLHVSYGQIAALKGISLSVAEGEIVTLIGANGAGKTTLLRTISGLLKSKSGHIKISGAEISPIIRASIAPVALTISTAETERGMR